MESRRQDLWFSASSLSLLFRGFFSSMTLSAGSDSPEHGFFCVFFTPSGLFLPYGVLWGRELVSPPVPAGLICRFLALLWTFFCAIDSQRFRHRWAEIRNNASGQSRFVFLVGRFASFLFSTRHLETYLGDFLSAA